MSSSDTTLPSSRRSAIRCDAVEAETIAPSVCDRHLDPAVLIGLSLAYARRQVAVPEAIALPLTELAAQGDATCRLVADWIEKRSISGSQPSGPSRSRGRARSRFPGTEIISAPKEGAR